VNGTAVIVGLGLLSVPVLLIFHLHLPLWLLLIGLALLGALAAGRRYRLTISTDGIELVTLRLYVVPIKRDRWLLDARIDLYESLEADGPEGLCVEERANIGDPSHHSDCFGPMRKERIRALWRAATAALEDFRAAAPPCSSTLRHPQLGPQSAQLGVAEASRHPGGRIETIVSVGPIQLGGLELPAGSRFHFNGQDFVDPRRDDRLVSVRVAAPVVVFGRTTHAQALLWFHGHEHPVLTSEAFDAEMEFEGKPVAGQAMIGFSPDGRMTSFTLARETLLGGFRIPAGSKLHYWERLSRLLPARWTCFLGAPLALPEITLVEGEHCNLSRDFSRLITISPHHDVALPDGYVLGGRMPLPVTPQGHLDRKACRRLGLFRGKSQ
jgi:hypothetical protein